MPQKKVKAKAATAHKKPTSARLLKHRPADPPEPAVVRTFEQETPETPNQEELLKTPENAEKRGRKPRQPRLPQMEDPEIEDLEEAAEEYATIRDDRIALNQSEKKLKDQLLALMKANSKEHYHRNGIDVKLVHENETVKIRVKKGEEDEE
jgi:hypothetical protein